MALPTVGWVADGAMPVSDVLALVGQLGVGSHFLAAVGKWSRPATMQDLYMQLLVHLLRAALGSPAEPQWPWSTPETPIADPDKVRAAGEQLKARSAYRGPWPEDDPAMAPLPEPPTWEQPPWPE